MITRGRGAIDRRGAELLLLLVTSGERGTGRAQKSDQERASYSPHHAPVKVDGSSTNERLQLCCRFPKSRQLFLVPFPQQS